MYNFAICLLLNHFLCSVSFRHEIGSGSEIYSEILYEEQVSPVSVGHCLWLRFQSQVEDNLVPDNKTERAL